MLGYAASAKIGQDIPFLSASDPDVVILAGIKFIIIKI
jgi:hypothetical protein